MFKSEGWVRELLPSVIHLFFSCTMCALFFLMNNGLKLYPYFNLRQHWMQVEILYISLWVETSILIFGHLSVTDVLHIWAEHNMGNYIRNISFLVFPTWKPSIFFYKPYPGDPGHSKSIGCCSPLVAELVFIRKFCSAFHSQQGHGLLFWKLPRLNHVLKTLAQIVPNRVQIQCSENISFSAMVCWLRIALPTII